MLKLLIGGTNKCSHKMNELNDGNQVKFDQMELPPLIVSSDAYRFLA